MSISVMSTALPPSQVTMTTRLTAATALLFLCLISLGSPAEAAPQTTAWNACTTQHAFVSPVRGEFDSLLNKWMAVDHAPVHSVQDLIATPGTRVTLEGKFAYGDISKDLEGEHVRVYLHSCEGWRELGRARTDDDGRTRLPLDTSTLPGAGAYTLVHVVEGDGSMVFSNLHVLPRGTKIALFDIDGTLTTADSELVGQILDPDDLAAVATDAVALTHTWAERGYHIVYMTGRPYLFAPHTRRWLEANGFAHGTLRTTDRLGDSMSGKDNIGTYKLDLLEHMQQQLGLVVERAYGNSSTDIWAYLRSGIAKERVFIRGPNRGKEGTQAIVDAYTEHTAALRESLAAAVQPWHRPLPDWPWLARLVPSLEPPSPAPNTGGELAGAPDVAPDPASADTLVVRDRLPERSADPDDTPARWWLGERR